MWGRTASFANAICWPRSNHKPRRGGLSPAESRDAAAGTPRDFAVLLPTIAGRCPLDAGECRDAKKHELALRFDA
jgi:hypothetical protein